MARRRLTALTLSIAALGLAAASGAAASVAPDETFFPRTGNPGYDVSHYDVQLAYRPARGWLQATARIEGKASQRLRHFSLDLDGMHVTNVAVDGEPAGFKRGRQKLKITPRRPPEKGQKFAVIVHYQGHPRRVTDPDGSYEGWKGYLADPSRANAEITKLNPNMPAPQMACVVARQRPFVEGTDGVGAMTQARWDEAAAALRSVGQQVDATGAWVDVRKDAEK